MLKRIQKLLNSEKELKKKDKKIKELEEEISHLNYVIIKRDQAVKKFHNVACEQFKLIKDLCFGNDYGCKEFNRLNKISNIAEDNIFGIKALEQLQKDNRTINPGKFE